MLNDRPQDHRRHDIQLYRRCTVLCSVLLLLRHRIELRGPYPARLHRPLRKPGAFVPQHCLGRRARLLRLYLFVIPRIRSRDRRHGVLEAHEP